MTTKMKCKWPPRWQRHTTAPAIKMSVTPSHAKTTLFQRPQRTTHRHPEIRMGTPSDFGASPFRAKCLAGPERCWADSGAQKQLAGPADTSCRVRRGCPGREIRIVERGFGMGMMWMGLDWTGSGIITVASFPLGSLVGGTLTVASG